MILVSSITGKKIRLNRLIQKETNTCIIFAIDHGLTSTVLFKGIVNTRERVKQAIRGGANVFMMSRGFAKQAADEFKRDTSLALMLSAAAAGRHKESNESIITPIGSVEEALRIGADAVVVFVALQGENEAEMISYVSEVGEACELLGMPFITEAEFPTTYMAKDTSAFQKYGVEYLKRNVRLCAELGADIIKTNWSGDTESFAEIVEAASLPVVVAGGPLTTDEELLTRMEMAKQAGAIGCSVGRNIFEHKNPEAITRAIAQIFRGAKSAQEALKELRAKI
jgi:fructose-bisphosphate aldolase/2-amino-3,7-dideoxy-D-threo-hept-6-ulosonate synthase